MRKFHGKAGKKIVWNRKDYYLFPTIEEMSKLDVSDFKKLGCGFRDKRLFKTTQMILSNEVNIKKISELDNTEEIRKELLKLDGVGEKVADCIMLFSLKRRDVFPIDVWVRRVMNTLYIHNEDETKVSKKDIQLEAERLFGDISGIAQQYLFYWARENYIK